MNLPIEHNFTIPQGFAGALNPFYIPGDYSSGTIRFEAATTKSISATPSFQKVNGDDDVLAVSYANGRTKITPHLLYTDTSSLTADYLYYNIVYDNGSTDRQILFSGIIALDKTVISTDNEVYTMLYTHEWVFDLDPADPTNPTDVIAAKGFDGTLSVSASGDVVTITSTSEELTDKFEVSCKGLVSQWCPSTTTYKFRMAENWETDYANSVRVTFIKRG